MTTKTPEQYFVESVELPPDKAPAGAMSDAEKAFLDKYLGVEQQALLNSMERIDPTGDPVMPGLGAKRPRRRRSPPSRRQLRHDRGAGKGERGPACQASCWAGRSSPCPSWSSRKSSGASRPPKSPGPQVHGRGHQSQGPGHPADAAEPHHPGSRHPGHGRKIYRNLQAQRPSDRSYDTLGGDHVPRQGGKTWNSTWTRR